MPLKQGCPIPGPWADTNAWPVRNWVTQQEVSSRQVSEASSVFPTTSHCSHHHLSSASHHISGGIRFSQEHEPYCECEQSGLHAPCEHHPEAIPLATLVCGKVVFHKTSPWCEKELETTVLKVDEDIRLHPHSPIPVVF